MMIIAGRDVAVTAWTAGRALRPPPLYALPALRVFALCLVAFVLAVPAGPAVVRALD